MAGSFNKEDVIKVINEHFGDFGSNKIESLKFESVYTPSIIRQHKDIEQLHLIMGLKGYGVGHEKMYNVSVLSTLLGGGMSSRLFQKVREERGLCYSIYTQNINYKDIGSFLIYTALNKKNVNELFEVTVDELNKLKQTILEDDLVKDKKEQLECGYLLGLESSINRMNAIGRSVILYDKIYTKDEILEKIKNVTIETLEDTIDEVFKMDNLSISMVGNVEDINLEVR